MTVNLWFVDGPPVSIKIYAQLRNYPRGRWIDPVTRMEQANLGYRQQYLAKNPNR